MKNIKITVVGGAGHIGLPLSIVFANKGFNVSILDKNINAIEKAKKGIMPFKEKDGQRNLKKALKNISFLYKAIRIYIKFDSCDHSWYASR